VLYFTSLARDVKIAVGWPEFATQGSVLVQDVKDGFLDQETNPIIGNYWENRSYDNSLQAGV